MKLKFHSRLAALAIPVITLTIASNAFGERAPKIRFTKVPPIGSHANLEGRVSNVNPRKYRVAVYIFVQGWWIKPTFKQPKTKIGKNGHWETDITTGANDPAAKRVAAFLIPRNINPPKLRGHKDFPGRLTNAALAKVERKRKKR